MSNVQSDATGPSVSASLSNLVVRLMREYTGRGPTRAQTHISGNLVAVVLEDTLTRGERSLVRDGEVDFVMDTRRAYQRTMRNELVAGVEEILGRPVIAFMSDNHVDPDMAVEVFVLGDGASADGAGPS